MYWNCLSDKVSVPFTNVDVIYYSLYNFARTHQNIFNLIHVLYRVGFIHMQLLWTTQLIISLFMTERSKVPCRLEREGHWFDFRCRHIFILIFSRAYRSWQLGEAHTNTIKPDIHPEYRCIEIGTHVIFKKKRWRQFLCMKYSFKRCSWNDTPHVPRTDQHDKESSFSLRSCSRSKLCSNGNIVC